MKLFIYTAVSPKNQNKKKIRNKKERAKLILRKLCDFGIWISSKRFPFKYYNYEDLKYSNKGDIAIRMAITDQLTDIFKDKQPEVIYINWRELNEHLVEVINNDPRNIFVVAGGGYFVFNEKGQLSTTVQQDYQFIIRINCSKLCYAVGVNVVKNFDHLAMFVQNQKYFLMIKNILDSFDLISTRDEFSSNLLKSCNIDNKIYTIPDPVVCLKPKTSSNKNNKNQFCIGVNFAFHGPFNESMLKKNFQFYVEALQKIQNDINCHFLYFVHSDSEILVYRLLKRSGLKIEIINEPPDRLIKAYKCVDICICTMLHSSIMSFTANTPFLNIAYDQKNISFCESVGMQKYCLDIQNIDSFTLKEEVVDLLKNKDSIRLYFAHIKEGMLHKINSFNSIIYKQFS